MGLSAGSSLNQWVVCIHTISVISTTLSPHRDCAGDNGVARDPFAGKHQTRHYDVLLKTSNLLRRAFGSALRYEASEEADKVGTRPDLVFEWDGVEYFLDTKVFDPFGEDANNVWARGVHVAFGNTNSDARYKVRGREARNVGAGFPFDRRTGDGEVKALCGQYTKGVEAGYNVEPLLFETFGGFAPPTAQLFYYAYELRQKFSTSEYDENTWATRTWLAFVTQQVSVALHKAVAREVKRGCVVGSGDTCDVRGKWVGSEGDEGDWASE